jgi:hypothetical protein
MRRGVILGIGGVLMIGMTGVVHAQDDGGGERTGTGAGTTGGGSDVGSGGGGGQGGQQQAATPPPVVVVREAAPAAAPREDDARKPVFYLEGGFGYSYVDLRAFSSDGNFLPSIERHSGSGYSLNAAAGLRVAFLFFGGRGTLASYENFEIGTAMVEAGIRINTPTLEPWARVGFGYGWMGSADYETPGLSQTDVYGFAFNGGFGLDIFLSRIFCIGVGAEIDILNMTRQRIDMDDVPSATIDVSEPGDAVGFQGRIQVHVGLHI